MMYYRKNADFSLLTTDMQSLTANFNMLMSSNLLCTQEETNYRFQCTNHVYFSYFKNDGNASFVAGILKAMPSTFMLSGVT